MRGCATRLFLLKRLIGVLSYGALKLPKLVFLTKKRRGSLLAFSLRKRTLVRLHTTIVGLLRE